MSPRAPTPCCCSTGQDGTRQASSTCPKTSRRSSCRPAPRSSTRSRTSGNICARTGSQTPYSKTTTRSSAPHAPRGEISSLSPKQSPPSQCATGLTSVSHYDPWYNALSDDPAAGEGWKPASRRPLFPLFRHLSPTCEPVAQRPTAIPTSVHLTTDECERLFQTNAARLSEAAKTTAES